MSFFKKVKGGQVKARRFLPFPRRFPNGVVPRSDGWKNGRMEEWKKTYLRLFAANDAEVCFF